MAMADRMKKCPRCFEDIKVAAIKCRYCRTYVVGEAAAQSATPPAPHTVPTRPVGAKPSSSKKGVIAAIVVLISVAVAVVVVAGISSKPKASTVVPPPAAAAEFPSMIVLTIRSNPNGSVMIDGRNAGTTPVSIEVRRMETPITIEMTNGSRSVKRTIVPDHEQSVTFGSEEWGNKPIVLKTRKKQQTEVVNSEIPQECIDFTNAVAKLDSCENLSEQTRNALRVAYGRESASWTTLSGDAKKSLATKCKASVDKLNATCKASASRPDHMDLIDPYADTGSAQPASSP